MVNLKFDNADFAAMKVVERELVEFLLTKAQQLHPVLLCFTLLRCARVFLRKGDETAQAALLPVLLAYLRGDVKPPGETSELLWTPPEVKH